MSPTLDWLHEAERRIRKLLDELRPKLLEAQGNIEHRLKDDKTVVTEMDFLVENRLRDTLAQFDASVPFSGEETGVDLEQETYWLVDPIDGTEAFIRGLPFCTNMIALIHQGEPVLGIINNFTLGDYYLAVKGHGATRNGHPIRVSERPMERAWVILNAVPGRPGVPGLYDKLSLKIQAVRRLGGAGHDLCMVASGAVEGRIQFNGNGREYDFAPGTLLVVEAGGRVANLGETTYDFRHLNHIAANPVIFDQLMAFTQKIPQV